MGVESKKNVKLLNLRLFNIKLICMLKKHTIFAVLKIEGKIII